MSDQKPDEKPDEKPKEADEVAYLKAENKKAFDARQKAKAEAEALRAKVEELERKEQERADAAEAERAKKAGEFDQLQQRLVAKHQAELEAERTKRAAAEQRLARTAIGRAFADAVDLFGPSGKTIYLAADAERIFGDRVTLTDDGTVAVLDTAGEVILDSKTGKPAAFASAMDAYIDSLPDKAYRLRGSGKTGSGSPGGTTGTVPAPDLAALTERARHGDKDALAALAQHRRTSGGLVMGAAFGK